jgi:hypothetical protein
MLVTIQVYLILILGWKLAVNFIDIVHQKIHPIKIRFMRLFNDTVTSSDYTESSNETMNE